MARFAVYSGLVLVGYSSLEYGDAPMGVAFGRLEPLAAFASIQAQCQAGVDQSHLNLSVQTAQAMAVPCEGVGILTDPQGLDEPLVEVLGIPYPLYETLFPEHVTAYERKFS